MRESHLLTTQEAWLVVLWVTLIEGLFAILATFMHYRRLRNGRGMSPMPPILWIAYLIPAFFSERFLWVSGFSFLRIVESGLAFAIMSLVALSGFATLPSVVAGWLFGRHERTVPKSDEVMPNR